VHRKLALLAVASAALTACSDPITSSGSVRLAPITEISSSVQTELVPNEYIVALRGSPVSTAQLSAQAQSMGAAAGAQVTYVYGAAVHGFAVKADAAAIAAIRANPAVEGVEPVQVVRADATQTPTPSWGLDRIDQHALPLNNSFTYPTGGGAVHVYIIDTGILTTHTDFTGRIGLSSNHIGAPPAPAWTDCNGHGTHVSGTTAGTTYGIMKTATIHAVRVLDCTGSGTTASLLSGINWVIANAVQPAVSNMSLGFNGISAMADAATTNMVNAGIVSAVAAGNNVGADACNFSPARVPTAITVASTTITDARSSFSNIGTCVDIFAPGSNIKSNWIGSNTATNTISGTSMATPHVTGAAALYLSHNPTHTTTQVANALINNATLNVVTNAGTGSPNRLLYMGFIGGTTNQNPVANFTYSCAPRVSPPGFNCSLDGSTSTDPDGTVTLWSWTSPGKPNKAGVTTTYGFPAAGNYDVTLTVTDNNGGTNSQTQTLVVGGPPANQNPVANFTFNCVVQPDGTATDCTFDGSSSTDADGTIVSYAWTAPPKAPKTGVIVTYSFARGAIKTISLTVTDDDGAQNTKSVQITVP
jgi:aqualysin 1